MANWLGVFEENPQDMPGQGLARTDNIKPENIANQFQWLMDIYSQRGLPAGLTAEQTYGPKYAEARLNTLNTTLNGTADTPGASRMYLDALRLADPENARLLDELSQLAGRDLTYDNQLDPNQARLIEQSNRRGAAARGMGYGPGDLWAETFAKTGMGEQLRDKRRANALQLQQLKQAVAMRPADMAAQASLSTNPNVADPRSLMQLLSQTYGENQQNNRVQAGLETQIGMHQASVWNDWFKELAKMGTGGAMFGMGGGGGGGMMPSNFGG